MPSLLIVIFLITMSTSIISPLVGPLFFSDHGFLPHANDSLKMYAYSLTMGVYALGMIVGNPVWGMIADKKGQKRAIIWALTGSLFGYALCFISFFLFAGVAFFFLGRAIDGLMAGRRAIALSMLAAETEDKFSAFRFSEMATAAGLLLGPLIAGLLTNFSEKVPFYYYASPIVLMLLLVLVNIFVLTKKLKPISPANVSDRKKILFNSKTLTLFFNFFIFQLAWYLYFIYVTPYIILKWHFTPFLVGAFFSILVLIYLFSLAIIAPCLKRCIKETHLMKICLIVAALLLTLIGRGLDNLYLFFICNAGIVTAMAINTPIYMTKISNLSNNQEQGKPMGIQTSVIGLAWLTAALCIGYLASLTMEMPFLAGGITMAIAAITNQFL